MKNMVLSKTMWQECDMESLQLMHQLQSRSR